MLLRKLNRQISRNPKRGKFWCRCDYMYKGEGKKCKVCGQRGGKKRRNKKRDVIDITQLENYNELVLDLDSCSDYLFNCDGICIRQSKH